jgi:hypothetical protein
MSKNKYISPFANVVFRHKHFLVSQTYDFKTGRRYFTVINKKTNKHSHVDNLKLAILIAKRAAQLYIPKYYSQFVKEAIRRVI